MIANSGIAICGEVFQLWNDLTEQRRRKRRAHETNMKKATRMIANNDKVLQTDVVNSWWSMVERIRHDRKAKEAGTAKAMRMMANSDQALMNICFDSWARHHKESKKKDQGNKKALRMIADSSQALIVGVWQAWKKDRQTKNAKEASTAKAVRMINSSSEAIRAATFQSWAHDVRKNRDKNKKIRALERSFGAQDKGTKMVVFTAWQSFSKVEGRAKRAKKRSMKTAIKSITGNQDLLLCHLYLAWKRFASLDRMEKLTKQVQKMEAELTTAVEEARVAVEEDLVRAKADIENIKVDIEAKKKERDEIYGSLDGLEVRLEEVSADVREEDRKIQVVSSELDVSKKRAKDIGDELGKVGVFIASHSPQQRKNSRTSNGGARQRPSSGNKSVPDNLPPIGSRPNSGTKMDGSKSARGVAGERAEIGY
jgi:hypothetical protein